VVPREIPMLPEKVPGKPPGKQSIRLLTAGSQFSGSSSFNHSAPLLNDEAAQEVSLEVEMFRRPPRGGTEVIYSPTGVASSYHPLF
jgi:hypothetical protein